MVVVGAGPAGASVAIRLARRKGAVGEIGRRDDLLELQVDAASPVRAVARRARGFVHLTARPGRRLLRRGLERNQDHESGRQADEKETMQGRHETPRSAESKVRAFQKGPES